MDVIGVYVPQAGCGGEQAVPVGRAECGRVDPPAIEQLDLLMELLGTAVIVFKTGEVGEG